MRRQSATVTSPLHSPLSLFLYKRLISHYFGLDCRVTRREAELSMVGVSSVNPGLLKVVDFELLVAELVVLESDVESVYDQGV